jgi:type IV secretory pathway VirB4 component
MAEAQKASQDFVQIDKIDRGVAYLKKGGLFRIVMVSGINFDLKSEDEQNLILDSFQNFINTLDFSVQFFIHSRKVNVARYLDQMKARQEEETNQLLKIQIEEYIAFIRQFVEENQIIAKTFFVVVPHHKLVKLPTATGLLGGIFGKPQAPAEPQMSDEETLQQLSQRVEQVIGGLEQIGLRAIPLEDEELTELFYNLYNPQLVEREKTSIGDLKK